MNKSLIVLALYLAAVAASANAQEAAELVETTGVAELRRASEAMIAPDAKNISIRLPVTVKKGEILAIEYGEPGKIVADSFMVTGITVKDGGCTIENKRNTAAGSALSDLIHARPCKKLK